MEACGFAALFRADGGGLVPHASPHWVLCFVRWDDTLQSEVLENFEEGRRRGFICHTKTKSGRLRDGKKFDKVYDDV